jgi:hypothetical protein
MYSQTCSCVSPLFSSHLYLKVTFSCPVIEHFIWIKPLWRGHLSNKDTFFSLSQMGPLNTDLTVCVYPKKNSMLKWQILFINKMLFLQKHYKSIIFKNWMKFKKNIYFRLNLGKFLCMGETKYDITLQLSQS